MNCFECDSPLHKDNIVGVCQRTPQCRLMYKRRYNELHNPCSEQHCELPECGVLIVGKNRRARYCSVEHSQKHYRDTHQEERAAHNKAWYAVPGRAKNSNLKAKYGKTLEWYNAQLTSQGGHCAICPATVPGGRGGWKVDHDHVTGRVRGLLCDLCNKMCSKHFEKYHAAGAAYIEAAKLRQVS